MGMMGGLGVPVRLGARLHARVVNGGGLAAGVEAHGAVLAEAVEEDGAVDESAEEGASVGGLVSYLFCADGGSRGGPGFTHSTMTLTTTLKTYAS